MSDVSSDKAKLSQTSWGPVAAILLGGASYFLPSALLILLAPAIRSLGLNDNITNFIGAFLFELVVIGLIMAMVWSYKLRLKDLGLTHFKPAWLGQVALGFVVYFGLSIVISSLFALVFNFDQNQVQDLGFNNPSSIELLLIFVVLVLLAPMAEELLFRGFIFKGLRQRLQFWPSTIIVSALFGLVHMQVNVGLDVFALSLVLCWLREKTGSLWPGITLHAFKNALAFVIIFMLGVSS